MHQIDMQDKQGFCLFLKIADPEKEEYLLSDATLVCTYYIREYLDHGIWIGLPVLEDSITAFSISPQGALCYKGRSVDAFRDTAKEEYIAQLRARIQGEALRGAAGSADGSLPDRSESPKPSDPYRAASTTTARQSSDCREQNVLKSTVKRIIEKRLEKYSDILFDVDTDWLEETVIDGRRCIVLDLDSIDAQNAGILSQMQLYAGARKSITRTGSQILFIGYD